MIDDLGPLLDTLVDRYCWDDVEVLREARVVLGSDIMTRREFFKTWEEKIKRVFRCCLLKIIEIKKECFGERSYIYYMKIGIRPPSPNPIIILDNKGINKLSPPSFCTDIMMEDKNIKDIKNKGDLKDLQLSYLESSLSSINKNILDGLLSESNISPRIERLIKRRKRAVPEYR